MSTVILNLITQIAKKMMQENLAGIVEHLVRARTHHWSSTVQVARV
jgi:hypothetical protein